MKKIFKQKTIFKYHLIPKKRDFEQENLQKNSDIIQLPFEILIKTLNYLTLDELSIVLTCCKKLFLLHKPLIQNFIEKNPDYFNKYLSHDFSYIADFVALANNYSQKIKKLPCLFHSQENTIDNARENTHLFPSWSIILLSTLLMVFGLYMLASTLTSNSNYLNEDDTEIVALASLLLTISTTVYIYTIYDWFKSHMASLSSLKNDREKLQPAKNKVKNIKKYFPSWMRETDPRLENLEHITNFVIKKMTNFSNTENFTMQFTSFKNENTEFILQKISYIKGGKQKCSGFFSKNYKKPLGWDRKIIEKLDDKISVVVM